MSKIIHLGFDGNIFLDGSSRNKLSYSKGLVEFKKTGLQCSPYFNKDLICKSMLKNAIVKMCGEIPFSTYNVDFIGEIYRNKDEFNFDTSVYEEVSRCIDKSLYNISVYKRFDGENDRYNIEFIKGLPSTKVSGWDTKTYTLFDGKYSFINTSAITFEKMKYQTDVNKETFDDFCDLMYELSGLKPYDYELTDIIKVIHNQEDKTLIKEKINLFKENHKKSTYLYKMLDFMINPLIGKVNGDRYEIDIRLNKGKRPVLNRTSVKYAIPVNGEIYFYASDELFKRMKEWYCEPRFYDGGKLYVIETIEECEFNSNLLIGKGFKKCNQLKEKHYEI